MLEEHICMDKGLADELYIEIKNKKYIKFDLTTS